MGQLLVGRDAQVPVLKDLEQGRYDAKVQFYNVSGIFTGELRKEPDGDVNFYSDKVVYDASVVTIFSDMLNNLTNPNVQAVTVGRKLG